MKKILFFLLFVPLFVTAQRTTDRYMTLRCYITQTGISDGKPVITANCTDFAGTYDATDVSVGDTLFFAESGQGFKIPIDSILSPGTPTVVFRADWTGLGVVYIPTGTGAIYEVTPDGLNATVAGLPESENQYLIEDFVNQIGTGMDTLYADTMYFKRGGNNFNVTDVKLGNTDNTGLSIITNNTKRVTVTAGGDVGIGTTSPTQQLELTGNIELPATTATVGTIYRGIDRFIHNYGTGNTYVGQRSGNFTMSGSDNSAYGFESFISNTSGTNNVAVGNYSLYENTTGNSNTAVGHSALLRGMSGFQNTAIGAAAGYYISTGRDNVIVGYNSNVSGNNSYNTSVGSASLFSNGAGGYNSAFGFESLYANTSGSENVAIGYRAGRYLENGTTGNATSTNSTFVGSQTRAKSAGLSNQIVIGHSAIAMGANSAVIGTAAGTDSTQLFGKLKLFDYTGTNYNIAAPTSIATFNVDGDLRRTAVLPVANGGTGTGTALTQGSVVFAGAGGVLSQNNANFFWDNANSRLGIGTTTPARLLDVNGDANINGLRLGRGNGNFVTNTGFGEGIFANASLSGGNNTAVGSLAMANLTSGASNSAFGRAALLNITSGIVNSAFGQGSLQNITSGGSNTAIGQASLQLLTTGSSNVAIGTSAGRVVGTAATVSNLTASNSVYIGDSARPNADNETNQIVIGQNAIGEGSNSVVLGNTAITKTILRSNVGIGTVTPSQPLHVSGNILADGSSARFLAASAYGTASTPTYSFNTTNQGDNGMYNPADDNIGLVTGGTERVRIHSTGNVSIGITTDFTSFGGAPLRVYQSGASNTSTWRGRIIAGGSQASLLFGELDSFPVIGGHNGTLDGWEHLYLQPAGGKNVYVGYLGTGAPSGSTNLIVSNRLGIGTTNPARTLHVTGEARITDLTTDPPTRIVGADADGDLGEITTLPVSLGGTGTSTALTQGSVVFAGASGVYSQNNSNLFWDNTNLRLGIKKVNPAYTLDIGDGSLAFQGGQSASQFIMYPSGTAANAMKFRWSGGIAAMSLASNIDLFSPITLDNVNNTSWAFTLGGGTNADFFRIRRAPAGSTTLVTLFATNGDGNVGIGTESPSQRLHVVGNILSTGATAQFLASDLNVNQPATPTYSFSGDGNTGMYSPGANIISFSTQGSEKVRIASNTVISRRGFYVGGNTSIAGIQTTLSSDTLNSTTTLVVQSSALPTTTSISDVRLTNGQGEVEITSGERNLVQINRGFIPTSGNGNYNLLEITGAINQTGGANGVVRGIAIRNTLTSAPNYRALEFTNNTGHGLYGSGTANNYLAGNLGVGIITPTSRLHLAGNQSAAAWGTAGIQFNSDAATFTNTSTAASGTVASAVFNSFKRPTLAATNTGVTTTDAATVYIENSPANGTNQTITNPYALWVDAGESRFDGNVGIGGSNPEYPLDINATSAIRLPNGNNSERPTVNTATFRYNNSVHHTEFSDGLEWYTMVSTKNLIKQTRIAAATTITSADLTTFEYVIVADMTVGAYQLTIPDAAATHLNKKITISRYTTGAGTPDLTIDNVGGGTDTFISDNDLVDDIVLVHNVDSQITLMCMETATNTYKWVQISK